MARAPGAVKPAKSPKAGKPAKSPKAGEPGKAASPPARAAPSAPVRVGPSREVVRLSEDLERMMLEEQLRQKTPKGKAKCPKCGAILEPTRNTKVRTHDNPVGGRRCEASGQPSEAKKSR